jgi:hypothetical protein
LYLAANLTRVYWWPEGPFTHGAFLGLSRDPGTFFDKVGLRCQQIAECPQVGVGGSRSVGVLRVALREPLIPMAWLLRSLHGKLTGGNAPVSPTPLSAVDESCWG